MSSKIKTTATKEEATPALVPKLRFPEFLGAAGWQSGQLEGALSSISNGLVLEQSSDTSGIRVTRIETISAGTIDLEKVGLVKTSQDISAYKLRVGDILLSNINSIAHIGKSVFVDRDYDLYHGMNLLRLGVDRTKHDPQFIYYLINTDGIRASLRERANKAVNQASINQTELGKTAVALPLKPEQQKVAECLSSVDELIAAQARKLDALKTHKKGLMQQLFPSEGETQPLLRFPEFQNAGEWSMLTLGQAGTFYNGRAYKQEELLESGKYPVLRVGNFFTNKNWYYSDLELDETKYCDDGDLLYAWSASFGPRVWLGGKVIYHYHIWKVEEHRGIDRQFLFITLENETERMKAKSANGLGLLHITKGTIEGWETSFPPQPEEQKRIASCLSSLDALITAETQNHEVLKTHKKGLMQQLFPSPEEVEA
jgi:type I restriction enzyme S subunit